VNGDGFLVSRIRYDYTRPVPTPVSGATTIDESQTWVVMQSWRRVLPGRGAERKEWLLLMVYTLPSHLRLTPAIIA